MRDTQVRGARINKEIIKSLTEMFRHAADVASIVPSPAATATYFLGEKIN